VNAYLNNISFYLPENTLSNADIERDHPEWSIEKIAAKTGISNRHIAKQDEFSSDMAVSAATIFFNETDVDKEDIDYLILCTQSPDYFLPTTACILQDRLGLNKSIGSIDVNQGCSGFIYSIGLAKGLIVSGQAKKVLVITSETYSKFINKNDKSNKTLFGDAAAVSLVSNECSGFKAKIEDFVYGTDGSGYESLIVKNGGSRFKLESGEDIIDEGNFQKNNDNLYMDGRAVFQFTNLVVPELVKSSLIKNSLSIDAIDKFVFHQANKFMLDKIRAKLKIPQEKFIFNSENIGNTVSSTIPISLRNLFDVEEFESGQKLMIAGFGVGLSYGATVLTIN
jgi:3-oxoacyl-[acyl-carrier-protein] synthase-3